MQSSKVRDWMEEKEARDFETPLSRILPHGRREMDVCAAASVSEQYETIFTILLLLGI